MILVATMIITALLITNVILFLKYVSVSSKLKRQTKETQLYRNLFNEANRKVKDEANKNIVLQSLINQTYRN